VPKATGDESGGAKNLRPHMTETLIGSEFEPKHLAPEADDLTLVLYGETALIDDFLKFFRIKEKLLPTSS